MNCCCLLSVVVGSGFNCKFRAELTKLKRRVEESLHNINGGTELQLVISWHACLGLPQLESPHSVSHALGRSRPSVPPPVTGAPAAQVGGGLLALYQLCQRAFSGLVVAELPFEPVWWFRGLARRGLPEGHAANACGMVRLPSRQSAPLHALDV